MFYLWVCAANLPIVINEMERDEQAATIKKLQKLLEQSKSFQHNQDDLPSSVAIDYNNLKTFNRENMFSMPRFNSQIPAISDIGLESTHTSRIPLANYGNRYFRSSDFTAIRR